MDRQGFQDQDDLLATLAAIMAQSPTWDEFCDHIVDKLQALACCFVFFTKAQSVPTLKSCRVWSRLLQWQDVDYLTLKQEAVFYKACANQEGAYLAVPIARKHLSGLLLVQYCTIARARGAWRSLMDMFAHHGALLWQELRQEKSQPFIHATGWQATDNLKQQLTELFLHAPIPISYFTPTGRCLFWNRACEQVLGWSAAELKRHPEPMRLLYPERRIRQQLKDSFINPAGSVFKEWQPRTRQGKSLTMLWANIRLPNGNRLGIGQDISQQRALENQQRLLASVFESSYDGIMITDAEHCITHVNPAFTRITGYTAEEVLGEYPYLLQYPVADGAFYVRLSEHLAQADFWQGEVLSLHKSGEPYSLLLAVSVVKNEHHEVLHHTVLLSDISYLKHHEAELRHLAFHDPLTGIPNRLLFAELLEQAMATAKRNQGLLAVCYLDLDGFKEVNDRLGHGVGDQLLIEVSQRLSGMTRGCDALSRLGGDEFALLLTGLSHRYECEEVLRRLQETLCQPMQLEDLKVQVSASIGVALYPQDANEAEQLIRCADHAMYQAKRQGKKQYVFFKDSEDQS